MPDSLCGLWIDDKGRAHLTETTTSDGRRERTEDWRPFGWLGEAVNQDGITSECLKGEGAFPWLAHADSLPALEAFLKNLREGATVDVLKPYENQWLLQRRARLYAGMHFTDLRRCQLDIETGATEPGAFSDARNAADRVLAIGLACGVRRELLQLEEESDAGEKRPYGIIGHKVDARPGNLGFHHR